MSCLQDQNFTWANAVLLFSSLSAFHCFPHRHCPIRNFQWLFSWEKRWVLLDFRKLCTYARKLCTTLCSLSQHLMPRCAGCCGQCPFPSDRHRGSHGALGTGHTSAVTGRGHSSVTPGTHRKQTIMWWSSPVWQQDALIQAAKAICTFRRKCWRDL